MSEPVLPDSFQELELFVDTWALSTETARNKARLASTMNDLRRFHDALLPRLPEVLRYLDTLPADLLSVPDANLLRLALSFAEISGAIEVWGHPDVVEAFPAERVTILSGDI